jgi:adenosylcobyric acid synthase
MVQGCTSSAGKSLIATVLCRHFARRGVRVAPFKGQNMSNHARVGAGGEMGAAQYFQALAAGVQPDVRMNPVLVKPEGERQSQVVVHGSADMELSALPWRERGERLRAPVLDALDSLAEEYELLVLEGAGSPAEINLADCDLANLAVARHTDARVLLVADIDRGGAFAHLYGTWQLLEAADRSRIAGWILNRFRGDRELLAPAPERLAEMTGVSTLGVVPQITHGLPEEDGTARGARPASTAARVAVLRYPTASNLDEFSLIEQVATLEWTTSPAAIESADLVVLPGSKHVSADLDWLRERGLADPLVQRVAAGGRVLAICGGMQLAGQRLRDEGSGERDRDGLGVLPLETTFARSKRVGCVEERFGELPEPWHALSRVLARGYEIRHGSSVPVDGSAPVDALPDGLGFAAGSVLGIYPHGLLEDPEIVRALLGAAPQQSVEQAIDALTDAVLPHLDLDAIDALAGVR